MFVALQRRKEVRTVGTVPYRLGTVLQNSPLHNIIVSASSRERLNSEGCFLVHCTDLPVIISRHIIAIIAPSAKRNPHTSSGQMRCQSDHDGNNGVAGMLMICHNTQPNIHAN